MDAVIRRKRTDPHEQTKHPVPLRAQRRPQPPADAQGTDEAQLQKFRDVRDQIEARILKWHQNTGFL